ncbi:MAG: hypothetical protein JO100_02860 [Pseudonocardia sp.]|jgi:hypothetical protein|nr:hypothetical protein [Pseudonocardia sp.]
MQLSNHHKGTLAHIFAHPASANVEWRQVRSLLDAVATTVEEPNGKLRVTLGDETMVLSPPHGKDVDVQLLIDLRHLLANAGLEEEVTHR